MSEDEKIHRGSGNIFADLGHPDPDLALAKSTLAYRIQQVIDARGLTQTQAAEIMGIAQPNVSLILRGRLRDVSIEKLMNLLVKLDQTVEVVVHANTEGAGRLIASVAAD